MHGEEEIPPAGSSTDSDSPRLVVPELPQQVDRRRLQRAFLDLGFDFNRVTFNRIDFFPCGVYVELDATGPDGLPQRDGNEGFGFAMHRVYIPYSRD